MTWITGIGDEVTLFFMLLLVIVIGVVAWVSTRITDQPFIRTVLILERRSIHRQSAEPVEPTTVQTAIEANNDTGQPDTNTDNAEDYSGATCLPHDVNSPRNRHEEPWEAINTSGIPNTSRIYTEEDVIDPIRALSLPPPVEGGNSDSPIHTSENGPAICRRRPSRLAFLQTITPSVLHGPVETEQVQSVQSESEPDSSSSNAAGNIRIRLKYLNDDQKMVEGKLEEPLGDFKRRHFSPELSSDKLVRLIFNGHVLQSDNETLQGCGLFDNCVVHCLVHQQRANASNPSELSAGREGNSSTNTEGVHMRDWDMGNILLVSVSLLLGVAWYCRFLYGQLFNATTTVALAGLTGILAISLVGIYLPDQDFALRH